eukprot:336579-Rhodomonas_salina.4
MYFHTFSDREGEPPIRILPVKSGTDQHDGATRGLRPEHAPRSEILGWVSPALLLRCAPAAICAVQERDPGVDCACRRRWDAAMKDGSTWDPNSAWDPLDEVLCKIEERISKGPPFTATGQLARVLRSLPELPSAVCGVQNAWYAVSAVRAMFEVRDLRCKVCKVRGVQSARCGVRCAECVRKAV